MNHDTIDVGSKAAYSFNQILVDPRHIMAGSDGGLNVSWDRGKTCHC